MEPYPPSIFEVQGLCLDDENGLAFQCSISSVQTLLSPTFRKLSVEAFQI